jgi:O-methyltransferase involved in polyketide biosynthesis
MPTPPDGLIHISDTAFWTAALRAQESERDDAIFRDPFARRLAGERGFEIVRLIRQPAVRYGVVMRTAAIDRVVLAGIRERGCPPSMCRSRSP